MTLSSTEVTEIIIKDGKAVGVKTRHLRGEKEENEYHAPIIISGAGAYITYLRLLPEAVPISFKESLKNFYSREKMATSVCLYLGLKESPAKLGFRGENYWIYSSYDHDEMFEKRNDWVEGKDEVVGAYLSFPSLKDPKATHHTADLIAFTDYKNFAKWKEQPWKKRDEEYKALKENIANKLLDFIEKRFPGFKDLVDFQELSTPVTNEHFTSHVDGAIYGLACVPERYDKTKCPWFETKTPIEGLYLTGADVASPGISGAMIGGLATVLAIHGSGDIIKWI
jgi:phytoene dehydrogenase-like protein